MKTSLIGASAALVLIVSGSAQADIWPGFFRTAPLDAVAADAWSGFLRPSTMQVHRFSQDSQERVVETDGSQGFYRGELISPSILGSGGGLRGPAFLQALVVEAQPTLFPEGLTGSAQGRMRQASSQETEITSFESTESAAISSALATTADDKPGRRGSFRLSAGYFDVVHDDDPAASFSLEYHAGRQFWLLDPFAGLMLTTEGAAYAYAGLGLDIVIADRVGLTPSFAVGAYHDGGGKDLGHWLEFRSAIELSYIFDNGQRLGLALYHLSNAGLGSENDGSEVLELSYRLPLDVLF